MDKEHSQLLQILKIGHDTSIRGEGISLRDAIKRTNYLENRKQFDSGDLVKIINEIPELKHEWLMYSEDKRTSGGWYLRENGEIGQVSDPDSLIQSNTFTEAVAEFVIRELDYWSKI